MKKHLPRHGCVAAMFLSAGSLTLPAQTVSPAATPDQGTAAEEPVQMSQFIVRTTAGMGYVDANSASGFKTNQSLLDIPQANLVLTQDFIKDIPVLMDNDLLQYAGVSSYIREYGPMIRGSRVGVPLIDGMQVPQIAFWDNDFIDSMEILKGTVAVLYQGTSPSGTLIYSTKKPLPFSQNIISVSTNDFGLLRGELDSTGPIGNLGDTKLSYRLITGWQNGGQYYVNRNVSLDDVHLAIEADYKNTKIMAAYDLEASTRASDPNGFMTPTGAIYAADPRKYEEFLPSGSEDIRYDSAAVRAYLIQKFSDNWEMQASAIFAPWRVGGTTGFADHIDWQKVIFVGDWVYEYNRAQVWQVVDDFTGKYNLGVFKCQSTFGFAHYQSTTVNLNRSDPTEPTYTIPISPAMWQSFQALSTPTIQAGDFPVPANPGSRQVAYQDNIYYQEQVDLIPKWLSAVAGWVFVSTESITDSNVSNNTPYTSTDESFHFFAPRFGVILHVTKDVSVYALDSQNDTLNGALDFYGNRLPPVQIISKEIGIKTALLDGHIVLDAAAFRISQTNQSVFAGQVNFYGNPDGYFAPSGTTMNNGWDGSLAVAPLPGLQAIATAYKGTVENQAGLWGSPSFGNMWSLVVRYDFAKDSVLNGLTVGTGWSRVGSRWISSAGEVFPVGFPTPSRIRYQEGTSSMAFVDYRLNRHWLVSLTVDNLLNANYVLSTEGPEEVDPPPPQSIQARLSYTF